MTEKEDFNKQVEATCGNIKRQLGERFYRARKEKGLILKALSKQTGVSIAVISELEQASSIPRIETLVKLSFVLEVPLNSIFDTLQDAQTSNEKASWYTLRNCLVGMGFNKDHIKEVCRFIEFMELVQKQPEYFTQ